MSQLVCGFKKRCGLAQCRQWIPKEGIVVTPKTWHNCDSCGKVRVNTKKGVPQA